MAAVQRDDRDMLTQILSKEQTYGPDDMGRALHYASNKGFDECVRLLLEANALPDIHDSSGCSALLLASKRGHAPVLRLLIKAGCNINKKSYRSVYQSTNSVSLTVTVNQSQPLTLSSLNLPLSSSPTTSRELLSQFSTCSG